MLSFSVGGGSQRYFCYQCERTVSIGRTPPTSEISCPICHGGFLEEVDSTTSPAIDASVDPFMEIEHPADLFSLLSLDSSYSGSSSPRGARSVASPTAAGGEHFDPFSFLQTYVRSLMDNGIDIQFIVDSSGGGGGSRERAFSALTGLGGGSATFGDYLVGPGLEELIQHLMDNDPNRYGTPPASKSAVHDLPDVKISEGMMLTDESHCAVCMDEFEIGDDAKQMPCKHIYHKDCILPWLELHNSCPVCRHELPTDDLEYESRREGEHSLSSTTSRGVGGGGYSGRVDSPSERRGERRYRIALPWPFHALDSEEGNSRGGADSSDGAARHGNSSGR